MVRRDRDEQADRNPCDNEAVGPAGFARNGRRENRQKIKRRAVGKDLQRAEDDDWECLALGRTGDIVLHRQLSNAIGCENK